MALSLPLSSSPLRELFDVSDLLDPKTLPTFPQARLAARNMFGDPSARAVHSICWRADGSLRLVRFGPRGGHKNLWTFTR
jgi:hypothetical protein